MIFPFGKKKDNNADNEQDKKKRSLDDIEADLTVLDKDEMNKVEGGKTNNSFGSLGDLRDSLGSTIPL
ncbi:MAG: hypothetical protein KIS77_00715 [Saprospiraceae bacterium]|jgi:hypothetical protein|nr:hypothetical protein [Saprospiraceae bacterium]